MKRRHFLGLGTGLLASVGVLGWKRNSLMQWLLLQRKNEGVSLTASSLDKDTICDLTPEQISGPYYFKSPIRTDVTEDRKGVPLNLNIRVVRGNDCQPVNNAQVEIWHCDAAGEYSGYSKNMGRKPFDTLFQILAAGGFNSHIEAKNDLRFLRGAQVSAETGQVSFQTIFPGWYDPRVPHIHVKVFVGGQSYLTSQLYFPDELCQNIYASHKDYKPHGACPYNHGNDLVLGDHPDSNGLLLKPKRDDNGLSATAVLRISA